MNGIVQLGAKFTHIIKHEQGKLPTQNEAPQFFSICKMLGSFIKRGNNL